MLKYEIQGISINPQPNVVKI